MPTAQDAMERVAALAVIGETVVEAVKESGLLKPRRRKRRTVADEPTPRTRKPKRKKKAKKETREVRDDDEPE